MAGTLDLNNVFSGETDDDKQSLLNHWKPLYEKTKNEDYNEYVKIIDLRLSGIKLDSFEDYVAYLMGLNTFGANGETPTNNPPGNNATSGTIIYDRELIKTIVSAAEFYINHIPTYKGKLKTRVDKGNISYDENDLAIKHLTDNLTEYTSADTTTIEYTNDKKIKLTKTFDKNNKITAAKREFKIINEIDNKQMYYDSYKYKPDEPILGHYKWKDIINNGNSYSVNTNFTGWDYTKDDCSGSIELILNLRESVIDALFNKGITTDNLKSWNNDTAEVLYKKGWVCYYRNDQGIWSECHGTTLEDITDKTNDIKTNGIKFLQPGDLLLCTGHGEFYVGGCGKEEKYKYNVTYVDEEARTNDEKKKSGISKITAPTSFSAPNSIKAEGTFAWGNVKDEFPVESGSGHKHYFYYDSVANCFRHCECGKEPTDSAELHKASDCLYGEREYKVIWRKK